MTERPTLTVTQRRIAGVVVAGAVLLAGIGFAGSYAAVRHLAERKGFGEFALVFPIGVDAGIGVLLALDLLLTWLRMPFPLLRPSAWMLTAATVAFNAAAAWPDPIGVGMHATIPVLFIVTVEAARHAIGRTAAIVADRHTEPVRLVRWVLAPLPTFRLWRRMKLWELRSYDDVIRMEQERIAYRMRLRGKYGRAWRRRATVEELLPLRLARFSATPRAVATPDFDVAADQAVAVATETATPVALGPVAPVAPEPATPPVAPAPRPARPAVAAEATPRRNVVHEPVAPPVADVAPDPATPVADQVNAPVAPVADGPQLLTAADIVRDYGVKSATVRSWVKRNRLAVAATDRNGRNLFDPAAVAALTKDS